jgi:hypothetical protein
MLLKMCVRKIKPEEFRRGNNKNKNITSDDSLCSHGASLHSFRNEEEIKK